MPFELHELTSSSFDSPCWGLSRERSGMRWHRKMLEKQKSLALGRDEAARLLPPAVPRQPRGPRVPTSLSQLLAAAAPVWLPASVGPMGFPPADGKLQEQQHADVAEITSWSGSTACELSVPAVRLTRENFCLRYAANTIYIGN